VNKDDFTVTTYCGSGPGGQHRNRKRTGVRIVHNDSGAKVECCEGKSQAKNKKTAFRRLVKSKEFMRWHRAKVFDMLYAADIEARVEKAMTEVTVEQRNCLTGKWEPEDCG
jgi:protein subunit release factor B